MIIDAIQFICIAVIGWLAYDGWKCGKAISYLIANSMRDDKENEK